MGTKQNFPKFYAQFSFDELSFPSNSKNQFFTCRAVLLSLLSSTSENFFSKKFTSKFLLDRLLSSRTKLNYTSIFIKNNNITYIVLLCLLIRKTIEKILKNGRKEKRIVCVCSHINTK